MQSAIPIRTSSSHLWPEGNTILMPAWRQGWCGRASATGIRHPVRREEPPPLPFANLGPIRLFDIQPVICGTARGARMHFSRFHHMGTVRSYVRPFCAVMTAGLDEVREAGGWIKGARFVRVTGFGLSCFGISSRGSSSVVHLTCRRSPGSSSRRSCVYAAEDPASIPVGSR